MHIMVFGMLYRNFERSIVEHLERKINTNLDKRAIIMVRPDSNAEFKNGYALPVIVVNFESAKGGEPETLHLITQRLELFFVVQIRCDTQAKVEEAFNKTMRYLTGFRASYAVDPLDNAIVTEKMYYVDSALARSAEGNMFVHDMIFKTHIYIQEVEADETFPIITTINFLENGI